MGPRQRKIIKLITANGPTAKFVLVEKLKPIWGMHTETVLQNVVWIMVRDGHLYEVKDQVYDLASNRKEVEIEDHQQSLF